MPFYIPRDADDKIGDMVSVAYLKNWDTKYDEVMNGSDIDEGDILETARAVFFICNKKKDI